RGPAYARNRGVEACRGSIILFTDADCLVMPDWAATAAARLERIRLEFPQTAALYGRLDSGGNYVARAYAYTSYAYAQAGRAGFAEYLNTACAAVTREGFVRAGGFSEDMRVNEDPDLALKLIEAGYRVYFEPSVFVVHEHGINRLGDFLSKQRLWGRQSALRLDLRHSRRAAAPLAGWLKIAPVHFLLVAPLALASAVKAVWHNRRAGWKVLQYFPLIVAGKLMFRWGNFTASARGCAGEK
ncbi:MAG: glycosyltransferase family 2 protein, partial [Candidatus Omnitrophota bacterium]